MTYTTSDVTQWLGISRQTVLTWVREFEAYLSPTASPDERRSRQFTDSDLRVFSLVASMKKQGLLFTDVHAALKAGQRGELPDLSRALAPADRGRLAVLQKQNEELQAALSEILEDRQRQAGQIELLTKQLETTQAELKQLERENAVLKYRLEDDK